MPVAKLCSAGTLNAMKTEEESDTIDTFIRQTVGKEPVHPFSRTGDSPVQWIQLLNPFEQSDLPGWPLLTPLKVQMQKCEKCSREFCSSINYRRHIRIHRRSLHMHKESHTYRDLLAEFWDKLSLEEAKAIVLLKGVMLKEISGSSFVRALASSLGKLGAWSLPQVYVKAGSMILEILIAKPSKLPVSSLKFFSILDDASEGTFLCAGTAESVQKYVFDGETGKSCLELKNLVATMSFLFEQQLVKAWVADKDAEALRCQQLLVEEEEAAQKRQVAHLERKKQRKLRQKEQRAKEQANGCMPDLNNVVDDVDGQDMAKLSESSSPSDVDSRSPDAPQDADAEMQFQIKDLEEEAETRCNLSRERSTQGNSQTSEHQTMGGNFHLHSASNRWQVTKSQKSRHHGFHAHDNIQTVRVEPVEKLDLLKERAPLNGIKIWAKKPVEREDESLNPPLFPGDTIEENPYELMIGSISVALQSSIKVQHCRSDGAQNSQQTEHAVLDKKNNSEKLVKQDIVQSGVSRVSKHWRPVSQSETKRSSKVNRGTDDSEREPVLDKVHHRVMSGEKCTQPESMHNDGLDGNVQPGNFPFSTDAAKQFLAQRWKRAISADHVKLVLSPHDEPPRCSDVENEQSITSHAPDLQEQSGLGDGENQVGRSANVKFRVKIR